MGLQEFSRSPNRGRQAERLAEALLFGPAAGIDLYPFGVAVGIVGVGILHRGEEEFIVILEPGPSSTSLAEATLHPLSEPLAQDSVFRQILTDESIGDLRWLKVPELELQALAGTGIQSTTVLGTAGPGVTWANGRLGFLTAGHVVRGGTAVTDLGWRTNTIGQVVVALDPAASATAPAIQIDVGLVEITSGPVSRLPQGSALGPGACAVDLHLAPSSPTGSTVVAMMAWYAPNNGALYKDVYMTGAKCTAPGHSGAMVTDNSGAAIGLVIAASTSNFTTYIQDIGSQLAALRGLAGFAALRL